LLDEIQDVPVQVTNSELARSVECIVDVLDKGDPIVFARAGNGSFNLPGLKKTVQIVDCSVSNHKLL